MIKFTDLCGIFMAQLILSIVVGVMTLAYSQADNCAISNNISLTLNISDICPDEPVTAQCVSKSNSNLFISWECSGLNGGRLVLCNDPADFICEFGRVQNGMGRCVCNNTIIMSSFTFRTPDISAGTMTLNCSNGEEEDYVVVSTHALRPPHLHYTNLTSEGSVHEILLSWEKQDEATYSDTEYVVFVTNITNSTSFFSSEHSTKMTSLSLSLSTDVHYSIYVTASRCRGTLTSRSANLTLHFDDTFTPAKEPTGTSAGKSRVSLGVGVGVGFMIIVVLSTIFTVCGIIILMNRKPTKNKTVFIQEFTKTKGSYARLKSVAAMHVDKHIFLSCWDEPTNKFSICKYDTQGRHLFRVEGFNHVRGIGRDSEENFYVADSMKQRMLKFDDKWRQKHVLNDDKHRTFYGLVVIDKYVMVCSKESDKNIHVFDLNLNRQTLDVCLPTFPMDITFLNDQFFVAAKDRLFVLHLDLENMACLGLSAIGEYSSGDEEYPFNPYGELRSICACNNYLYVVERGKRLFCFKYDSGKLQLEAEDTECHPVILASNGEKVYCSQEENMECFVSEVTIENGSFRYLTVIGRSS